MKEKSKPTDGLNNIIKTGLGFGLFVAGALFGSYVMDMKKSNHLKQSTISYRDYNQDGINDAEILDENGNRVHLYLSQGDEYISYRKFLDAKKDSLDSIYKNLEDQLKHKGGKSE